MRQLSQSEMNLKAATARSIHAAGGLEAAAMFVRVGKTQLANYYNPRETECFVPVDVAVRLDELAGYPNIAEAVKASLGDVSNTQRCFHGLLSSFLKEAGEVGSVMSDSLAKGDVCPRDADAIIKEARDVQEALQHIIDGFSAVQARAVA